MGQREIVGERKIIEERKTVEGEEVAEEKKAAKERKTSDEKKAAGGKKSVEEKREDRRVKYTLMVIRESFIKLLKQKPIAKITIKEICEDADINRATFYAHYTDQYDLLWQIEKNLIDDVNEYLSCYNLREISDAPVEMIQKILEYIKENAELFDLLLNSNGDIQFLQEFEKVIGQKNMLPSIISDNLSSEDAEYLFLFFAHGSIGVIQKWLSEGMKKPAGEMARLILKTVAEGRKAFLDNDREKARG